MTRATVFVAGSAIYVTVLNRTTSDKDRTFFEKIHSERAERARIFPRVPHNHHIVWSWTDNAGGNIGRTDVGRAMDGC